MIIAMDKAGRIVIPKNLRERAGFTSGEPLEIRYDAGRIEIEPAAAEPQLVNEDGFWVASAPDAAPIDPDTVRATLAEVREERERRALGNG